MDPKPDQRTDDIEDEDERDEDFDEEEEEEEEEEEDEDEIEQPMTPAARARNDQTKMESLFERLATQRVPVRVHDVIIKGNIKTKDSLIESHVADVFANVSSFQQLLRAASVANMGLQKLDVFDSVNITLEAGPPELPGTANVVIEVVEAKRPFTGDFGVYTKPEARSCSIEGSLKLKNSFGYGDLWDCSVSYGLGQSLEVSSGVSLPRFKSIPTPVSARISLVSQDWLNFSSYTERALGLTLGLLSTGNHDLSYNLSLRTLADRSQVSSKTVRSQLGHGLLSALKYTFKVDKRDSPLRPTRGHAFASTTQIGGLFPDYRSLRFIRQEFDLRYAIPFGFYRTALNLGISGGAIFPWGSGFLNTPSYLPERFFMGGNSSPVCSLRGPTSILGFKSRGLGPAEPRRLLREGSDPKVDFVGGDLAVTAFADLSFDLPLKVLRDHGVHGHLFACAGSLNKITENAYRTLTFQKFKDSFRTAAGFGIVIPTQLFRMEVNYCYILRQAEHDRGKTGIQFSFSSP